MTCLVHFRILLNFFLNLTMYSRNVKIKVMRKVKNCYGCLAHTEGYCLLGYERNKENCNIAGPKGMGHTTIYSSKECCHKPKTIKEFLKRLKED